MSAWNPFLPTQRDINRTEELAKKSSTVASILAFLFYPMAMIYLNRGVNNLKIFGYTLLTSFTLAMVLTINSYDKSDRELDKMIETAGKVVNVFAVGAHIVESSRAVTLARKRKKSQVI